MDYTYTIEKMYAKDETGKEVVLIKTPVIEDNLVNIKSVFVDESLRGQGVAGEAMMNLCNHLRRRGIKAIPTCPYAISWFQKHTEYSDVLKEE